MTDLHAREITREDFAAFLDTASHSVFQRLAWLDVVKRVYRLQILFLGYFRGNTLCAVSPVLSRRIGPFRIWGAPLRKCGTPPVTPFCAPGDMAPELVPVLRDWARMRRIQYLQVAVPASERNALEANGTEPLDNLELDLRQPLESIWKSIAQQRTSVRKAVREGVRVGWRHDLSVLEIQRVLLQDTYGRQGSGAEPNFPMALYRDALASRHAIGLRVLCATHQGRVVGAVWILADKGRCYYWDAATLHEARALNVNHLLLWVLIRWAHRKKLTTFDFVGPSSGGRGGSRPGIGLFKQSMGGRPVDYDLLYWYSPLMRKALMGYRWLNRVRVHGIRKPR